MLGFLLCDNNIHVQYHARDSCGNAWSIQLKAQRFYLVYTAQKSSKVRSCPTLDWPIQNHMYFIKDVHCLVLEYQGMTGIFILKMALNSSSINICFTYCSRPKPCAFKPPWRRDKMVSILVSPLGRGAAAVDTSSQPPFSVLQVLHWYNYRMSSPVSSALYISSDTKVTRDSMLN